MDLSGLCGGLTPALYRQKVEALRAKLDEYNTPLSIMDITNNALDAMEKELANLNEQMLSGVGSRYDKDRSECEQAGAEGKRLTQGQDPQGIHNPSGLGELI